MLRASSEIAVAMRVASRKKTQFNRSARPPLAGRDDVLIDLMARGFPQPALWLTSVRGLERTDWT